MAEEKVAEKPTMDDGQKPDEKKQEQSPEEKARTMLETLEALDIRDENHLKGVVETAQKFGPQAQELGQLRDAVERLVQENQSLRESGTRSAKSEPFYNADGETIDLSRIIYDNQMKANRDFYQKEIMEPQQRMQTQYFAELDSAQNDQDYPFVKQVFDEHINSPQVQAKIARGQTTVSREYDKTVRSMYRNLLKQTTDTLKGVIKPGDTKVPQVESQTQVPAIPTDDDEKAEYMKNILKARKDGSIDSDKALEEMVKGVLSPNPDDPMFKFGE
jgi:hypothetical protein